MSELVKGNINDILNALKEVQDKNVYSVYIPSLKKNVLFKEMTTKQEKMVVKTIVDNPVYNSEFIFVIREIIKQNCAEELDIDSLTLIDKTAICLSMRMKSIGNEFEFRFPNTNKTVKVDVSEYVEKFKNINIPEDEEVGTDDVRILCGYPTISTEYELEKELRSKLTTTMSVEDARNAIGVVFTNELVKYIKQVTIIKKDVKIVLDMSTYTFDNRITILEEIGNKATSQILDYIEKVNKDVKENLRVVLDLPEDEKKIYKKDKLTGSLETGSRFFTNC